MTPSWAKLTGVDEIISDDLSLQTIANCIGPSHEMFLRMYRKRLVHFHAGQTIGSLTVRQIFEHQEMVQWGIEQGATAETP